MVESIMFREQHFVGCECDPEG